MSLVVFRFATRVQSLWRVCLIGLLVTVTSLSLCQRSLCAQDKPEFDDGLPSALLFPTKVNRGKSVAALDKALRDALVEDAPVHLVSGHHKKLSALQAAAHCHDESVDCMRAVARSAGVEVLLVPSLERGSGEFTLTLMAFDARADAITRVVHWQDGAEIAPETYAALPNLIAGVFPEPGPPDMDFVAEANADSESHAQPQDSVVSGSRPLPLAPLLVAGGGALLLGAGVVTGLMLRSTQQDYDATDIRTRMDAEAADDLRTTASTEATLANIFYGLGGVALVASGTWLAIELFGSGNEPEEHSSTRLTPWVTPRQFGLVLQHQGGLF